MRSRISTLSVLGVGVVTALTIGATAVLVMRAHEADLVAEVQRSAAQLSRTIQRSTHHDMLENRRESLHRQIEFIGHQQGIEVVRVYNKSGRIVFSSEAGEVGRSVDKRAEACYACHAAGQPLERLSIGERARIFQSPNGHRVLGMIEPIENEPACATGECHAHAEGTVLGVLDVAMSLEDADRRIAYGQARMAGMAAAAIAAGSLIIWWLNRRLVLQPVSSLVSATRRVAQGDLATRIPVSARHELGDLQRDFNRMVERLAEARAQITQADKLASVGRLAAGVAHEINNPLTGVLTYASFLLRRVDGSELKGDLEVIVRETKRCREIVRGLLDFARQAPSARARIDVNDPARRAATIVGNQLSLNRARLSIDLAGELPEVTADANQIQQVIVNLIVNAADAVADGGRIWLRSREAWLPAWGTVPIRRARCPEGCDLLVPGVAMNGHPALRVLRSCQGSEARLHVDAISGALQAVAADRCPPGAVASFACPRCRAGLDAPERRCDRCGSPAFEIAVPPDDRVYWCARVGCAWSAWASQSSQGERLFVELSVEDEGAGIPPSDRARLFEPFFTTKGTRGTGLGLSVSWGIVTEHGGVIDVDSKPGSGSRFTVRLPAGGTGARSATR